METDGPILSPKMVILFIWIKVCIIKLAFSQFLSHFCELAF